MSLDLRKWGDLEDSGPPIDPFAAMGAIAHFDANERAYDDGSGSVWFDRIRNDYVQSTSAATRLQYGTYAALNGRRGWLGVAANSTKLTKKPSRLADSIDIAAPNTVVTVQKRAVSHTGSVMGLGGTGDATALTVVADALIYERSGGGYSAVGGAVPAPGDIHVFGYTFNNTGRIYVDGTEIANGVMGLAPSCTSFTIGSRESGVGFFDAFYDGHIGDVVVWDRELSAAEMLKAATILRTKFGF